MSNCGICIYSDFSDASLTHVIKLAAHSSTSSTPTATRQSFIMIPYYSIFNNQNVKQFKIL
jgi:hypothetical protein